MKVSIITPTHNSELWIMETYKSIQQQTYTNWEWVITDDCSTDRTRLLLTKIAEKDSRVKIFHNKVNSGAAVTRNNSIKHAKGDYIAFLDSDDLWHQNKLDKQIKFMEENSINFSFTAYELIDEKNREIGQKVDTHLLGSVTYEEMLKKKATLGCSTVMLRTSAFDNLSMPLLRTGQDYATWLKLLKAGENAFPLLEVLTQYRILRGSISRNKFKKANRQWQIYRQIEKLPLLKSVECFCFYAWRAIFRK